MPAKELYGAVSKFVPWSEDEKKILKKFGSEHTAEEIKERFLPHRTANAIRHRRERLSIKPTAYLMAKHGMLRLNLSKEQVAYLAGFIDGEGSLTISVNRKWRRPKRSRHYFLLQPSFTINNTDKGVIDWIAEILGLTPYLGKRREGWQQIYIVQTQGFKILPLLKILLPYLRVKKRHCKILIEFIEKRLKMPYGAPYDEEDLRLAKDIRSLNVSKHKLRPLESLPLYKETIKGKSAT